MIRRLIKRWLGVDTVEADIKELRASLITAKVVVGIEDQLHFVGEADIIKVDIKSEPMKSTCELVFAVKAYDLLSNLIAKREE